MQRPPAARALAALASCVLATCALAGCSSSDRARPSSSVAIPGGGASTSVPSRVVPPPSATPPPSTRHPSSKPQSSTQATSSAAQRAVAAMSDRERVGQLIMIDCPSTGVSGATRTAVTRYAVGSVILDGTSQAGLDATKTVTADLRSLAPSGIGLFVSTDQEGGLVQRLQGPGFSRIPSALEQGRSSPAGLRADAKQWGAELGAAGVDVNLAPVLDVVPSGGGANPPIGDLDRQYGSTPGVVTSHGLAYARGMADAGVDVAVKHFPGLGRVSGNTDATSGVIDSVTTADDPNLAPFRAAIKDHVPFVMMSTAIYRRIDPDNPAAFSKKIVTGLLRDRFGFGGVIISDDVGVSAQVSGYSPGERAVRFVDAGGDMVLTVVAGQAQAMTSALLQRARSDPAFRKKVDAAALRVLQAKQARGLLG